MNDYPTNIDMPSAQNNEDVKVSSVITSTPKTKPQTPKGVKGFLIQNDFRDIRDGVINDIIAPKVKDLFYDIIEGIVGTIESSFQMMIFGDYRPSTSSRRIGDRVSYNSFSKKQNSPTPSVSSAFICDDLSYESKGDAELVLMAMKEHLRVYPYVTVAQMYEFSNMSQPNWTSNNYGWNDLSGAMVKRNFDGEYIIDLPKAKPINR